MNFGKLNKRIEIQSATATADNLGGRTATWATDTTVWAAIAPKASGETVDGKEVAATNTYEITIRYNSVLTGNDKTRKEIKWGNRYFRIDGVISINEANKEMLITATETKR